MTHSGGKEHAVGDRGQRYEVSYYDPNTKTRKVMGWSASITGAQQLASAIEKHPVWIFPWVTDPPSQKSTKTKTMNNGELIGYDLDGVIVKEYRLLSEFYSLPRAVPALIHFRDRFFPQLYKPLPGCHIVTGRPHWEQASTERWLRKREVPYARLHMALDCPYSNRHIYSTLAAKLKARVIKEFGLKYFVESSDHQLHILRQLGCPALDCVGALSMGLLFQIGGSKK